MTALKAFCKRALGQFQFQGQATGRDVAVSPPGCGKSQICKALGQGNRTPRHQTRCWFVNGFVSRSNGAANSTGTADHRRDENSCGLLDELDKAFAGVAGSGASDSGVSSRMFGTFLSWLNDRESDTFVVCTANDVGKLPPEFARAERFDAVYFVDLPSRDERRRDLVHLPRTLRNRRRSETARRHGLDRRRDQSLLPIVGAAGQCR